MRIRYEADQKLAQETDPDKKVEIVNKANGDMAKAAIDIYQKLSAQLITAQTANSPLRFKMDPNL